jgi:hypothetical protein
MLPLGGLHVKRAVQRRIWVPICLLFKTQLNSLDMSLLHRKHITSPLRAQQVNAIYRFVAMV